MTDQRLAVREATAIVERGFDDATIALIKKTVGDPKNPLTTDELALFLSVCRYTGLNPLNREIYPLRIQGRLTIWTGIDGHRRIAQASPRFRGMAGPYWCGPDGQWTDVWLGSEAPAACKVGVYLPGRQEPTWGIAYYKNYKGRTSDTWKSQPEQMLAVRAESFALRKCFSRELAGVALPDDEPEWGDGALDTPEPTPPSRGRAIAAGIDASIAETDALLREPLEEMGDANADIRSVATYVHGDDEPTAFEQEQPPAADPLAAQRAEATTLYEECRAVGMRVGPPHPQATDIALEDYVARHRRMLNARASRS